MVKVAGATKPATIYDVARLAGVSHQTVSRLLRGLDGIRPETRSRVESALEMLDYRANLAARHLRQGRTGVIALTIPSLNQPYFAELAQAVIHAARERELSVFVETTESDRGRELAAIAQSRDSLIDGMIFAPTVLDEREVGRRASGYPLVLLGDQVSGGPFDHVVMANEAAAAAATAHLLATGRRRIAVLGAERSVGRGAALQRLSGYRRALSEADIPFDPRLAIAAPEWIKATGVAATDELIATGLAFDAIFGFNDALALGALRALLRSGRRVPEDVAVIGFDDTEDGFFSTPSLTSISPGRDEIARTAVRLLAERIAGEGDAAPREVKIDFELMHRESTVSKQL